MGVLEEEEDEVEEEEDDAEDEVDDEAGEELVQVYVKTIEEILAYFDPQASLK
jgi:hypothetical protein